MNRPRVLRITRWGLLSILVACTSGAEFLVDPSRSSVEVAVRATADNFTAHLDRFQPAIQVDKMTGHPTGGSFSWNFKDLNTGSKRRDKEMLHWLEHDQHPGAVFSFSKCVEKNGQLILTGELKMHGVSREIALPLQVARKDSELMWESTLELDHQPYGLPRIVKFALLKVDPVLKVHFKLSGTIKD
jgi:polyisoprenoid-binding protein YceI